MQVPRSCFQRAVVLYVVSPVPIPGYNHLSCSRVQVVRHRAATNLGELTRMSARVDPLALDLANSGRTAEAQVSHEDGLLSFVMEYSVTVVF